MYPVSASFADDVKGNRELSHTLTVNGVAFTGHLFNLTLDRLDQTGGQLIGNAVSQTMTLETDTAINIGDVLVFSLTLDVDTVPFTPMTVTEVEYSEKNRKYTVKAHDVLYFATNKVKSAEITLPCTWLQYLEALCEASGIVLATTNFGRYDQTLTAVNVTGDETIAAIIGKFAEAVMCNAYINRDGELELKDISDITEEWDAGTVYMENLLGQTFVPDGVCLAREPQEGDDVVYPDTAENPLRIVDNPFLDNSTSDADRLVKATEIWSVINGLTFTGFDMQYRCNFALDPWDGWTFAQVDGTTYTTYYPGDRMNYTGGLKAAAKFEIVPSSAKAGTTSIANYLKDIYIKVDKANATIEQRIATVEDDITALSNTITSNAEQTEISIQKAGGNNLIRNSAFYKDAEFWDVVGTYQVTMNTETERETDSGTKIAINGSVTQSGISTINGQQYTLAGTWDPSLTVSINGQSGVTTWYATGDTTLTISGTGTFWDMRIVKGNSSLAWTQHADELYGRGVLIDNTGVTVRSLSTDSTAVVDEDSFEVRHSGSTVAELSAEVVASAEGRLTNSLQVGDNILVAYDTHKWMVTGA